MYMPTARIHWSRWLSNSCEHFLRYSRSLSRFDAAYSALALVNFLVSGLDELRGERTIELVLARKMARPLSGVSELT